MRYTNENFFEVIGHTSVLFSTWDILTSLLLIRLVKRQTLLPDLDRKTLGQKLQLLKGLASNNVVDVAVLERVQSALPKPCPLPKSGTDSFTISGCSRRKP